MTPCETRRAVDADDLFYARGILEVIGLSRVVSADLERLASNAELSWLWIEWTGGSNSLLRYDAESESGILRRTSSATDRASLPGLTRAQTI